MNHPLKSPLLKRLLSLTIINLVLALVFNSFGTKLSMITVLFIIPIMNGLLLRGIKKKQGLSTYLVLYGVFLQLLSQILSMYVYGYLTEMYNSFDDVAIMVAKIVFGIRSVLFVVSYFLLYPLGRLLKSLLIRNKRRI